MPKLFFTIDKKNDSFQGLAANNSAKIKNRFSTRILGFSLLAETLKSESL